MEEAISLADEVAIYPQVLKNILIKNKKKYKDDYDIASEIERIEKIRLEMEGCYPSLR